MRRRFRRSEIRESSILAVLAVNKYRRYREVVDNRKNSDLVFFDDAE